MSKNNHQLLCLLNTNIIVYNTDLSKFIKRKIYILNYVKNESLFVKKET